MRRIPGLTRFTLGRLARRLPLLGGVGLVLAASVYVTGTRLEANDAFCASCHVEPETSYYQASLEPDEAATLAAFHAGAGTRCIDCHSRQWIPGRLWAQFGGLQNLMAYWSGNYTNPGVTTRPVGDGGCSKCHSDLTWVSERPGHYHSPRLRRHWRIAGGPSNTCETCHPSHRSVASTAGRFLDTSRIQAQCDACHEATSRADQIR